MLALQTLVVLGVALSFLMVLVLCVPTLLGRCLTEGQTRLATLSLSAGSFLSFVLAGFVFLLVGQPSFLLSAGSLFSAGHFTFDLVLLVDSKSLLFSVLSTGICGVVAAFGERYLHHESGFNRFFCLLSILAFGMLCILLAGNIEVLFAGWEFLGLSSALLVAFFLDRPLPTRNALRVFTVYRIGDAALLAAAILLLRSTGAEGMSEIFLHAPEQGMPLSSGQATAVGLLLLVAVAAKCAQLPFSNWLPRAMEGPTPSSAVFYGALSIHAGAYLLLRLDAVLLASPVARYSLLALGALTALYSTLVERVQTDIKSALAFASLTQVSIILVEISLGLETIAVIHIFGHACLRLLQFLRSPSILQDVHHISNAIGHDHASVGQNARVQETSKLHRWLYRHCLERWLIDNWLDALIIRPYYALFRRLNRWDKRVCRWVDGTTLGDTADKSSDSEDSHA